MEHEWFEAQFVFGSWIECTCGFRPDSHEEFNTHSKDHNIQNAMIEENI